MKKRLLALALCLVLATSLLPITAAATTYYELDSLTIMASGVEKGSDGCYRVNVTSAKGTYNGAPIDLTPYASGNNYYLYTKEFDQYGNPPDSTSQLKTPPEEGSNYYTCYNGNININNENGYVLVQSNKVEFIIPGYQVEPLVSIDRHDGSRITFRLTKIKHTWQFTQTENSLTATCESCNIDPVSVTLKADSVTLPESPFNARLEGKEQFETATGAAISKIRYDYKGSDGVWQKGVDPVSANAKAGEYQAFVQISNLPRPVESDGVVAMAENPDGTYTADLFVKYTAVDPAVTAQTGDNRPIELMMGSVVLFSALAAAAFVLDSKRKYSR